MGGFLLVRYTPVGTYLSREGVERGLALLRGSPWAPAIFVAAYGVAMVLALPGTVLTLAGGALFGFWWGVVFNTLGANLGANGAFLLARWLGRDGVERLAGDRLKKLDRASREFGFRGLFSLRLVPLIPFNALNFGAGLTAMSWGTYAAATALGILPGTVVYTMFADALLEGSQEASRQALIRVGVSAALLIFLSLLPTIVKKLDIKLPGGTALLLAGLLAASGSPLGAQALPDHQAFTDVLRDHVHGKSVDYAALKEDERARLEGYLAELARTEPAALERASRDARLAFWINAYNACMLKQVVNHYPIEKNPSLLGSIKNALADRPDNSVWQIPDVFTRRHCAVAGADRSQDEIEHEIIRPMDEPRIHFAVNCAAVSCPRLAEEAYVADRLDAQLDRQVEAFVADPDHFRLEDGDPPVLTVNRVLDWYEEDFGGPEGLKRFFAPYLECDRRDLVRKPRTRVEYFDYDWTLNDVTR